MTDEQFENLAKRWPDLFQKAKTETFAIDIGWLPIIETLCGFLSSEVENARFRLRDAVESSFSEEEKSLTELEACIAQELEDLPTIVQVKEKFGGLRFYIDGGNEETWNYINFAESVSLHMCETCGAPGEIRNTEWVKTLCEQHYKELKQEKDL